MKRKPLEKKELTIRQKQILRYIIRQIDKNGYAPSVREIGKAVGLSSTATVHAYLRQLEDMKYISKENQKGRTLRVLKKEVDLYIPRKNKEPITAFYNKKEMVDVPVVGKITAGSPILAVENVTDTFPIPCLLYTSPSPRD